MPVIADPGFVTYRKPAAPKKKAAPQWGNPTPAVAGAIAGQNVSTPGSYNPPAAQPTPRTYAQATATPAAPTPTPAAPTFNYSNAPISDILGSDPFYQQLLGLDRAQSEEERAQMNQQIHRQQRYYGSPTDPLSVFGRIETGYQDQLRNVTNMLAAHGTIFSGDLGARNNRARLEMEQSRLDANMRLQDYVEGLQRGFTQAERQRKFSELQAQLEAVNRWLTTNQPTVSYA